MSFLFGRQIIKAMLNRCGYDVVRLRTGHDLSCPDIDEFTKELYKSIQAFTLTSLERVAALRQAVEYIISHNIPGDIVECGVWKGGSMMAVAKTLIANNCADRKLYLFDTFSGMTPPTELDKDLRGADASALLEATHETKSVANVWGIASLELVKNSMQSTGYQSDNIIYVQGKVEETIPESAPDTIALLRLDTDWYESTYHELVHLFPRLSVGGILLIDDYGHWQGAKRAVDQYMSEKKLRLFLHRIDYTGRLCIKLNK